MSYDLAPGNVLQNMYLKNRIKKLKKNGMQRFLEVGAGNGNISKILLECGLIGEAWDLSEVACELNKKVNASSIKSGRYRIHNSDFLESSVRNTDIIISSHTIEHLPDDVLELYFKKCSASLAENGVLISIVPAGKQFWGIEDETVGHYRRFEFEDIREIASRHGFRVQHIGGLTFPLSNWFFILSNFLIAREDGWKKKLTKAEQTLLSSSGARNIRWKSTFPNWVRFFINEFTLFPFYVLQIVFSRSKRCMVIYSELTLSLDR